MKVIKLRRDDEREKLPNYFYCGRAFGGRPASPLGNPFIIGTHGTRAEVIEMFRRWLWEQISIPNPKIVTALRDLAPDTILGCYCVDAPDALTVKNDECHCGVIARAARYSQTQK